MDILKRSLETVLSPLGILSILFAAGLLLRFAKPQSRLGPRLLVSGALLFMAYLFTPLSEILIAGLETPYQPMFSPPTSVKIDRIVVLSGYAEERHASPVTSNVSEETIFCMAEGIRLYRLLPGAKLLLSGGIVRRGEKPVASIMADFIQQMGVPAEDIIVEGNSRNTYENLLEIRKLVGSNPFILVTAACHLRRATGVARKLQMNPYPAPARIWILRDYPKPQGAVNWVAGFLKRCSNASPIRLDRLQWAFHEYVGYVWYWVLDRV